MTPMATPTTDTDRELAAGATTGTTGWQKLVGVAGLVVVLWVGSNLFDVVTSGASGPGGPGGDGSPGGHAPPRDPPAGEVTDETDSTPPTGEGSGHDPSQFDHG
jgi:hypothetical protein